MGLFTKLFEFIFGKKQDSEIGSVVMKSPEQQQQRPVMPAQSKKPRYQPVPRTRETNDFVDYMVKKASNPDPVAKPHKDSTDQAMISRITNKLKEDLSKKP